SSFESCGKWLQGVRATRPSSAAPLPGVLIAAKADLREGGAASRAVVDRAEGERFARENGLAYFEVSALHGKDVATPFEHMAGAFHRAYRESVRRAERAADADGM
ncbi:unnamed protein product, partial [Phaeothamnion confervicola]